MSLKHDVNSLDEFNSAVSNVMASILNEEKISYAILAETINQETDYGISKSQMYRYVTGATAIPFSIIVAFCRVCRKSVDEFTREVVAEIRGTRVKNTEEIGEKDDSFDYVGVKSFLAAVFGQPTQQGHRSPYAFDIAELRHDDLPFNKWIFGSETERTLHTSHLRLHPNGPVIQRGTLTFRKEMNNICSVVLKWEKTSNEQENVELRGFALILNSDSIGDDATVWAFLKRGRDDRIGSFAAISFNVKEINNNEWYTRIAEVLNLRVAPPMRSTTYKMLITEEKISDEKMRYFSGMLKFSAGVITVPKTELCNAIKSLESDLKGVHSDESRSSLKDYLDDNDKDALKNALECLKLFKDTAEEGLTISYRKGTGLLHAPEFADLFRKNPKATAWLRNRRNYLENFDRVYLEPDRDAEEMYKLMGYRSN